MSSEYGYFFNSRNGDRVYNADSMQEWLRPFFVTGVFQGELQVTADSGMTVHVATGNANIDGKVRYFDSVQSITLDPANGLYPRVDLIVVERNDSDREITTKVVKGEINQPAPTRVWDTTTGVYQLVLAEITIGAGVVAITQADITDTRMVSEKCGYVAATVDEIDFSQIDAQFQAFFAEFKANELADYTEWTTEQKAAWTSWITVNEDEFMVWFEHLKDILDENTAGHLQNEIEALQAQKANESTVAPVELSPARAEHSKGDLLYYQNVLYEALSDIHIGDTLTVGTNIDDTNVADNINAKIASTVTIIERKIEDSSDGFEGSTTVFNNDGSITTTYSDRIKDIVFNPNGSITETLKDVDTQTVYSTKVTTFNNDGSITETVTNS